MAYVWKDIDYKLKAIDPSYVPIEERSPEEQEEAYDRSFDWAEQIDEEREEQEKTKAIEVANGK